MERLAGAWRTTPTSTPSNEVLSPARRANRGRVLHPGLHNGPISDRVRDVIVGEVTTESSRQQRIFL
jgi:hypothetical protein